MSNRLSDIVQTNQSPANNSVSLFRSFKRITQSPINATFTGPPTMEIIIHKMIIIKNCLYLRIVSTSKFYLPLKVMPLYIYSEVADASFFLQIYQCSHNL